MHVDDTTPPLRASDLVIRELAESEARLMAEARDLAADVQAYRELAHVSVAAVARLTRLVTTHSRTIIALCDELKRYTAAAVLGRAA